MGFTIGFDPTKIDESKFEIDASKTKKKFQLKASFMVINLAEAAFYSAKAMRQLGFQNKKI